MNRKRNRAAPIRDLETIQALRRNLKDRPRDLLLFDLITQTGLRIKSIISLKVKDLNNLKVGQKLNLLSDPDLAVYVNRTIYRSFRFPLETNQPRENDYLFKSRKGTEPLKLTSVSHLVRKWYREAGLEGMAGVSSLRKTWEFYNKKYPVKKNGYKTKSHQVLKPVETTTLQGAVYKELKQAILSGKIKPGERLFTEAVARHTNVSETPAREALARLEAEGFLLKETRKGFRINKLSPDDLKEIFEIRLKLETMAAKEALTQPSIYLLERMESILDKSKQARKEDDIERYVYLNKEFHHTLYSSAHMPTLNIIISYLWDRMTPYLNLLIRDCHNYNAQLPLEYHQGMISGIRNQDPDEVCKWLAADLNQAAKVLSNWFEQENHD